MKTKLGTLDESTREALQEGFKNHYQGLAGSYNRLMNSKDAQERQLGRFFCRLDYENLYNALKICLEKQESIDIFFCLDKYFELINDIQSQLKLSEFVCQAQEAYPSELRTGEIGYEIVMARDRLAFGYLQTQKYQEARESYQKIGELLLQLSDVEERQKQPALASTYHQLEGLPNNYENLNRQGTTINKVWLSLSNLAIAIVKPSPTTSWESLPNNYENLNRQGSTINKLWLSLSNLAIAIFKREPTTV